MSVFAHSCSPLCSLLFSSLQIVCSRVFCLSKFVVNAVTALLSEECTFSDEFAAVLIFQYTLWITDLSRSVTADFLLRWAYSCLCYQFVIDEQIILCWIFKLKKMRLTKMIVKEQVLWGKPVTGLAVSEFQKRGIPHIHLLASRRYSRPKRAYPNKGASDSS